MTGIKTQLEARVNARWFSPPAAQQKTWVDQKLEKHLIGKRQKNLLLNRTQSPPVIVVGNLVVGGGGKTPLILELAKHLTKEFGPGAIICSGYGSEHYKKHPTRAMRILPNNAPQLVGDEAVLLAQKAHEFSQHCYVYAAKQRNRAYQLACTDASKHGATLRWVLSDDGLQHFDLPRAMQIVCIDDRGLGNERVLPLGPLREPIDVLESMDAIVIAQNASHLSQRWNSVPVFTSETTITAFKNLLNGQMLELEQFKSHLNSMTTLPTRSLLAGIANPSRFFELFYSSLSIADPSTWQERPLADHAPLENQLAEKLKPTLVVMTEKDAVKWRTSAGSNWWAMCIERRADSELLTLIRRVLE